MKTIVELLCCISFNTLRISKAFLYINLSLTVSEIMKLSRCIYKLSYGLHYDMSVFNILDYNEECYVESDDYYNFRYIF